MLGRDNRGRLWEMADTSDSISAIPLRERAHKFGYDDLGAFDCPLAGEARKVRLSGELYAVVRTPGLSLRLFALGAPARAEGEE